MGNIASPTLSTVLLNTHRGPYTSFLSFVVDVDTDGLDLEELLDAFQLSPGQGTRKATEAFCFPKAT